MGRKTFPAAGKRDPLVGICRHGATQSRVCGTCHNINVHYGEIQHAYMKHGFKIIAIHGFDSVMTESEYLFMIKVWTVQTD